MHELLGLPGRGGRDEHRGRRAQGGNGGQHDRPRRLGDGDDGVVDTEELSDDRLTGQQAGESLEGSQGHRCRLKDGC